jgi:hypothetical protein
VRHDGHRERDGASFSRTATPAKIAPIASTAMPTAAKTEPMTFPTLSEALMFASVAWCTQRTR